MTTQRSKMLTNDFNIAWIYNNNNNNININLQYHSCLLEYQQSSIEFHHLVGLQRPMKENHKRNSI